MKFNKTICAASAVQVSRDRAGLRGRWSFLKRALFPFLFCMAGATEGLGASPPSPSPSPKLAAYFLARADTAQGANASEQPEPRSTPVFTDEDVSSVRSKTESTWLITSGRQTRSEVILRFKGTSAARIRKILASQIGESLTLLVDGKVIAQQLLSGPFQGEEFSIAGTFTPDESKTLAKQIKAALL